MSDVSVCIPYADTDLTRARALNYVAHRYKAEGYEVIIGRGSPSEWRKAEAVQDAVRRASHDLLVIADGDVWTDHLDIAIEAVLDGAGWAVPHWQVHRLTDEGTVRFIAGERDDLPLEEQHHGVAGGGIVVLHRETYERCPLDPRFVGWGGEDKAWSRALKTLAGKGWRQRQPLWHLWHPPQNRMSRVIGSKANDDLRAQYAAAAGMPRRMRELIAEGAVWDSKNASSSVTL